MTSLDAYWEMRRRLLIYHEVILLSSSSSSEIRTLKGTNLRGRANILPERQ